MGFERKELKKINGIISYQRNELNASSFVSVGGKFKKRGIQIAIINPNSQNCFNFL